MHKYKVLVLTDHFTHSKNESIYPLCKQMAKSSYCETIDVASRGNSGNKSFFLKHNSSELYTKKIDETFCFDIQGKPFITGTQISNLKDYDVVFLRIDRPFTQEFSDFITSIFAENRIINKPSGMKITGSKEYLLNFSDICPAMQLCKSIEDIENINENYPIVLKPLESYGGFGLIKIENKEVIVNGKKIRYDNYLPTLRENLKESKYLAMKYLKNVVNGDKRIIVINGKIMGAVLRLPPPNSYICNLSQGGSSSYATVTDEEINIMNRINPSMIDNGVLIYGFDTLENDKGKRVLSEINTLNVGGLIQAEEHSGRPIIRESSEQIWSHIKSNI